MNSKKSNSLLNDFYNKSYEETDSEDDGDYVAKIDTSDDDSDGDDDDDESSEDESDDNKSKSDDESIKITSKNKKTNEKNKKQKESFIRKSNKKKSRKKIESSGDDKNDDDEEEEDEEDHSITIIEDSSQEATSKNQTPTPTTATKSNLVNKIKCEIRICCICLNEQLEYDDELVECDLCGLYVHEGCYGIADNESKISTNSSASTEPWFCNSCLLDVNVNSMHKNHSNNVNCDLCPNKFGILKETEAGRLVHAVCALYTPDVAYQDTDKLWPVVLDEIPFLKWGEQVCSLCDDVRYSRSGICIKCDAGLCKVHFHVTCAQKHGLLVDPMQQIDSNSHDIYLAYCKQHGDRSQITIRKRNYLAMISNYKEKGENNLDKLNEADKERLLRKLKKAKQIYENNRIKRSRPLSPKNKIPRMITTCPSALNLLMKKAELVGAHTDYRIDQQQRTGSVAFSADFVNYYFDREKKVPELYSESSKLKDTQEKLKLEDNELRKVYEKKLEEYNKEDEKNKQLKQKIQLYIDLIEKYSKHKLTKVVENLNLKSNKHNTNTTTNEQSKQSSLQQNHNHQEQLNNKSNEEKHSKMPLDALKLNTCTICKQSTNLHLMIDCDTCKNYYHINCLDPPLTSVPKKTKLYGWECSTCGKSDSDSDNGETVNLNAPRSLRHDKREEKKTFNLLNTLNHKSYERVINNSNSQNSVSKKQQNKNTKKRTRSTGALVNKLNNSNKKKSAKKLNVTVSEVKVKGEKDDDYDDDIEIIGTKEMPPSSNENKPSTTKKFKSSSSLISSASNDSLPRKKAKKERTNNDSENENNESFDTTTPKQVRPIGRPRKSLSNDSLPRKKAKKEKTNNNSENENNNSLSTTATPPSQPKPVRGRPRKSLSNDLLPRKIMKQEKSNNNSENESNDSLSTTATPPSQPKPVRGRPRKSLSNDLLPRKKAKKEKSNNNSENENNDSLSTTTTTPSQSKPVRGRPRKSLSVSNSVQTNDSMGAATTITHICNICKEIIVNERKTMLKCDKCSLNFHGSCLQPPVKNVTQYKGYAWMCKTCDSSSDDEDEESVINNHHSIESISDSDDAKIKRNKKLSSSQSNESILLSSSSSTLNDKDHATVTKLKRAKRNS